MHDLELQRLGRNGEGSVAHYATTPDTQSRISDAQPDSNGDRYDPGRSSDRYTESQTQEKSRRNEESSGNAIGKASRRLNHNNKDSPRKRLRNEQGRAKPSESQGLDKEAPSSSSKFSFSREVPWKGVRDHLALERTFLGWLRTSGAFAMTAVLLAQISIIVVQNEEAARTANPKLEIAREDASATAMPSLHTVSKTLASITVGLALVIVIIGVFRFHYWQQALIEGGVMSGGWGLVALSAIVFSYLTVVFIMTIITSDP